MREQSGSPRGVHQQLQVDHGENGFQTASLQVLLDLHILSHFPSLCAPLPHLLCDMLNERNSDIILLKLRDVGNINSVVFIDIFNDVLDLCGYPLRHPDRNP